MPTTEDVGTAMKLMIDIMMFIGWSGLIAIVLGCALVVSLIVITDNMHHHD